jgi:atypical dual specificity phosphatase
LPERFSWVVEGVIAGMERPGLFNSHEDDLAFLKGEGIGVIVNLEEKEHARDYEGFIVKHIPVNDFKAPGLEDFREFIDFVNSQLARSRRIAVHCYAGMGRTNLMIACFLMHHMKIDPGTALDVVKMKRPFHLVTWEQEEALKEYYFIIRESLAIEGLFK